jgi:hypothetical protein
MLTDKCVLATLPRVAVTVSPAAAATGQKVTITWSAANAPTGSYVYLELLPVTAGPSVGTIVDKKGMSGSYVWTVPASDQISFAGDYHVDASKIVSGAIYKVRAGIYTPSASSCIEGCSPVLGKQHAVTDSSAITITTSKAPASGGGGTTTGGSSSFNTMFKVFSLMGSGMAAVADGYLAIFGLSLADYQ